MLSLSNALTNNQPVAFNQCNFTLPNGITSYITATFVRACAVDRQWSDSHFTYLLLLPLVHRFRRNTRSAMCPSSSPTCSNCNIFRGPTRLVSSLTIYAMNVVRALAYSQPHRVLLRLRLSFSKFQLRRFSNCECCSSCSQFGTTGIVPSFSSVLAGVNYGATSTGT